MKLLLLCVGRRAQDPLIACLEHYVERLERYTKFEMVRLKESEPTREAAQLLARLEPADHVIALDETGSHLSTMALVHSLRHWQQSSVARTVFVVGGAHGLDASVKKRAHATWSLSAMTLPHRLAQVVLVEQLYRAHTIIRGEKYHHA